MKNIEELKRQVESLEYTKKMIEDQIAGLQSEIQANEKEEYTVAIDRWETNRYWLKLKACNEAEAKKIAEEYSSKNELDFEMKYTLEDGTEMECVDLEVNY